MDKLLPYNFMQVHSSRDSKLLLQKVKEYVEEWWLKELQVFYPGGFQSFAGICCYKNKACVLKVALNDLQEEINILQKYSTLQIGPEIFEYTRDACLMEKLGSSLETKNEQVKFKTVEYLLKKLKENQLRHGDLHEGNILFKNDTPFLIDPKPSYLKDFDQAFANKDPLLAELEPLLRREIDQKKKAEFQALIKLMQEYCFKKDIREVVLWKLRYEQSQVEGTWKQHWQKRIDTFQKYYP